MRDLRLTDKNKALHIKLYCPCCKAEFHSDKRGEWPPVIRKGVVIDCKHPVDKIYYKTILVVPKTINKRKTRKLETRSSTKANQLALEFRTEMINNNWGRDEVNKDKEVRSRFLVDTMGLYIDFLNNVNVPYQKQKIRHIESIKDVRRTFDYFMEFVETKMRRKPKYFDVEAIDDYVVGEFLRFLTVNKNYKWKYNTKHISTMSSLTNYLIKERGYSIKNYFEGINIPKPKGAKRPQSIAKKKFEVLLKQVEVGDTHQKLSTGEGKLMYYDWLVTAFKLHVHLGCRRKGTTLVKWSDIELRDGNLYTGCIEMCDYKNSSKNEMEMGESEETYDIPIYKELEELLMELGYEEKKGTDEYILAPKSTLSRSGMEDKMSKAFTHYYKQLGYKDNLQLGCLRKTYTSAMKKHFGDNYKVFTGHSKSTVVDRHYFDSNVLIEGVKNFKLWNT